MRYWSDVLNRPFDTEEELNLAENEILLKREAEEKAKREKEAAAAARQEEIAQARENAIEAIKHYFDLVNQNGELTFSFPSFSGLFKKTLI